MEASIDSTPDMNILVVHGYPKSGLPAQQVERLCGWKYRLHTVYLIFGLLLLSTGSLWVGLRIAPPEWGNETLLSLVMVAVAFAAEFAFVHLLLG